MNDSIYTRLEQISQKLAQYEQEIASLSYWARTSDDSNRRDGNEPADPNPTRDRLEMHLRAEAIRLPMTIGIGRISLAEIKYRLFHLEKAIEVLERFPEYEPDRPLSQYWGGEIFAAYLNRCSPHMVWIPVKIRIDFDAERRPWAEIPVRDQLMYILMKVRRRVDDSGTVISLQLWRDDQCAMFLGAVPIGRTQKEVETLLLQIVDAVAEENRLLSVNDMKKAIAEVAEL
jgi:hypothetical protein